MNHIEREMQAVLTRLRDEFGCVAVKAEFEAEGTRREELSRLVEIARRTNVKIGLKIGGCEAITDLQSAILIGVDYVIAPMVETAFALKKYILAVNKVFTPDQRIDTEFLYNLETITAFDHRVAMADVAAQPGGLKGIVFGRTDYTKSMEQVPSVNSPEVTQAIIEAATLAQAKGLDFVVGGGVAIDAIDALREVQKVHLTRFETRKVIFAGDAITKPNIEEGFRLAVTFEALWLLNKREHYGRLHHEDDTRLAELEKRWGITINGPGGIMASRPATVSSGAIIGSASANNRPAT